MNLKATMHATLDRFGFSLVRKPKSNLAWYYPVPVNSELPGISLLYERIFGRDHDGVFVEVGAFDGYNFSNTFGLAERGWTGYLIEPDLPSYEKCVAQYAARPKITVSKCAISDGTSDELRLTKGGLLTTSNEEQAKAYRETQYFKDGITEETFTAQAVTLDEFLTSNNVPVGFDVLVVDVEGATDRVFAGFDLPRWRPRMMIVELFDFHPTMSTTSAVDTATRRQIVSAGYEVIHKDSINTIFLRLD